MGNSVHIAPGYCGAKHALHGFCYDEWNQKTISMSQSFAGFIQTNVAVNAYGRWITTKQRQATLNGMPVAVFIKKLKLSESIRLNLIGGKEVSIYIKRFFQLLHRLVLKAKYDNLPLFFFYRY
jgi:hypothetical protein